MSHSLSPSLHRSPQEAMQAPPEEFLYLACLRGPGSGEPDFLAVVDAAESRILHELPMPNTGDELHHFGWNRCSSACHGPDGSHLIVPGMRSSRLYVVNVADDPRRPTIEPEEVVAKTGYTRPHTVHCMPGDNVVISMLGDAEGNRAGGFAVLDAKTLELKGRWENGGKTPRFNYDFWSQPRKNALVSSEFREAERLRARLRPRRRRQGPLREQAALLEPRRAAARADARPRRERPRSARGALAARPRRRRGLRRGRALEHDNPTDARRDLNSGPNVLQLSYDGRRLYVSDSLYSTWDDQFYPDLRSWLWRVNCDPNGGMELDHDFFVDFHDLPDGPARAHEERLQGGDCTTEIFQ